MAPIKPGGARPVRPPEMRLQRAQQRRNSALLFEHLRDQGVELIKDHQPVLSRTRGRRLGRRNLEGRIVPTPQQIPTHRQSGQDNMRTPASGLCAIPGRYLEGLYLIKQFGGATVVNRKVDGKAFRVECPFDGVQIRPTSLLSKAASLPSKAESDFRAEEIRPLDTSPNAPGPTVKRTTGHPWKNPPERRLSVVSKKTYSRITNKISHLWNYRSNQKNSKQGERPAAIEAEKAPER